MRPVALVAALAVVPLLAGCLQADPGGDGDGFEPTCPSWMTAPGGQTKGWGAIFLFNNQSVRSTSPVVMDKWDFAAPTFDESGQVTKKGVGYGDPRLEYNGHPLDQLVFDFNHRVNKTGLLVVDAEVHFRFIESIDGHPGADLVAWDRKLGRSSAQTVWTVRGDAASGGYAWFNRTLQVDLADPAADPDPRGVFVYWDWVYNLDGDIDTPSVVFTGYSPQTWYRTCGAEA